MVLHNLNEGMLTPENVTDLQTMYPALYKNMAQKITSAIVDQVAAGEDIPYTTRLGLSTLLGQPMDSTISQPSIMAAQLAQGRIGAGDQEQEMRQQKAAPASQTKPLTKMAQSYQTAGQARQQQRQSDKV